MECLSPLSIPRPGGHSAKDRISVPCGKCFSCLSNLREAWSFRLQQELRVSSSAVFVTLTYNDENYILNKFSLSKIDVQLFLKRLRQFVPKVKVRYYLAGEYGSKTFRPHYHAIIFNLPYTQNLKSNKLLELLTKSWKLGFVHVGLVTGASISYTTKYLITKQSVLAGVLQPFSLMSKGLGSNYIQSSYNYHVGRDGENKGFATTDSGYKISLPRYYRNKMFTKEIQENMSADIKAGISKKQSELEEKLKKEGMSVGEYELSQKNAFIDRMKNKLNKNSKL